jgi:hypothetical protein
MNQKEMARLRKSCVEGNSRACDTLEQLCEGGYTEICHYVP